MVRMKGGKTGAACMSAAIAMVFAGAAHAQSTVTLYGIVDAGVTYTNNAKGHALWQFTGGNESGPRWGLIGTEDLGGGLRRTSASRTASTSRTARSGRAAGCSGVRRGSA